MTTVAVFGAKGRMGREVVAAVEAAPDLVLGATLDVGDDRGPAAAADVVVDFTVPDQVMDNLQWAISHGLHCVVGTTGFTPERLDTVRRWLAEAPGTNAVIASNFSSVSVPSVTALESARSSITGMKAPESPPTALEANAPPFLTASFSSITAAVVPGAPIRRMPMA